LSADLRSKLPRTCRSAIAAWLPDSAYIAGCHGAYSTVREALSIGFPGRHVPPSLLRCRRRRAGRGDEPRAARRAGHGRLPADRRRKHEDDQARREGCEREKQRPSSCSIWWFI